jgi:hypothetical protein
MKGTENISVVHNAVTVLVIKDAVEGFYTASLIGMKGGPIVSAPSYDEVCTKFRDAFDLACSLKNLITYNEAVNSAEKDKSELAKGLKKCEPDVNFVLAESTSENQL